MPLIFLTIVPLLKPSVTAFVPTILIMPLYEICHSYPLTRAQKDNLASFITTLHSQTFTLPSLFVNVQFTTPEPVGDYYVGGISRQLVSPNRLIATVRIGPSRPKSMFDEMGVRIREKWDEIVQRPYGELDISNSAVREERERKNLHFIVFKPMTAAVENGVVIPGPGEEGSWLKDNMDFFREQAESYGDVDFRELLEEVEKREDLKALVERS